MFARNGQLTSGAGLAAGSWRAPASQQQQRIPSLGEIDFDTAAGFQGSRTQLMVKELAALKQDNANLQMCLYELQADREKLRTAVRKLKVENGRLKAKVKRVGDAAKLGAEGKDGVEDIDQSMDYNDIGQFLLIGGVKDPLDLQFVSPVKDSLMNEFKTGERYLWYKMAEHFGDAEAMQQLLGADDQKKAEEIVNKIKDFNQAAWDAVKLKHFEEFQRMKFDQHRDLKCLLLKTSPFYLAIASQDKVYGTGWRKQRREADQPKMWDGENLGGKVLMKLRDEYAALHNWQSTAEEQEAQKLFSEHKQSIWKRMQTKRRPPTGGALYDDGLFYGEGYTSFLTPAPRPSFGVGRSRGRGQSAIKRRR